MLIIYVPRVSDKLWLCFSPMLAEHVLIAEEKGKYPEGMHPKRLVKPGIHKWLRSHKYLYGIIFVVKF